MVEKIKTDVDRLFLVLKMKQNFRYIFIKLNFFSRCNLVISMYKIKINRTCFFTKYHMPLTNTFLVKLIKFLVAFTKSNWDILVTITMSIALSVELKLDKLENVCAVILCMKSRFPNPSSGRFFLSKHVGGFRPKGRVGPQWSKVFFSAWRPP